MTTESALKDSLTSFSISWTIILVHFNSLCLQKVHEEKRIAIIDAIIANNNFGFIIFLISIIVQDIIPLVLKIVLNWNHAYHILHYLCLSDFELPRLLIPLKLHNSDKLPF